MAGCPAFGHTGYPIFDQPDIRPDIGYRVQVFIIWCIPTAEYSQVMIWERKLDGIYYILIRSQQTWAAAAQAGVFADEIVPIVLKSKKVGPHPAQRQLGFSSTQILLLFLSVLDLVLSLNPDSYGLSQGEVEMTLDEHPKPKTTIEQLAKLPTVFKKVTFVHVLYVLGSMTEIFVLFVCRMVW